MERAICIQALSDWHDYFEDFPLHIHHVNEVLITVCNAKRPHVISLYLWFVNQQSRLRNYFKIDYDDRWRCTRLPSITIVIGHMYEGSLGSLIKPSSTYPNIEFDIFVRDSLHIKSNRGNRRDRLA